MPSERSTMQSDFGWIEDIRVLACR
jgi:hypothetical protein